VLKLCPPVQEELWAKVFTKTSTGLAFGGGFTDVAPGLMAVAGSAEHLRASENI
jgi:hypothetical protein